jgi:nucleoside-diphosphate-sugar epimerase
MRLDVAVNMLTFQALKNKRITVFGGDQTRPNIHIEDLVDVYTHLLAHPEISSGCYNAGFENISILEIARRVTEIIPAEVIVSESNDPRSYRLDSSKLLATGYKPRRSVGQAIRERIDLYQRGQLIDDERSHTVKWMRTLTELGQLA